MLSECNLESLRKIAYDGVKPFARLSALKLLFDNGTDLHKVQTELEKMVDDEMSGESTKVRALSLLDSVNDVLRLKEKELDETDAERVKKELLGKYL